MGPPNGETKAKHVEKLNASEQTITVDIRHFQFRQILRYLTMDIFSLENRNMALL